MYMETRGSLYLTDAAVPIERGPIKKFVNTKVIVRELATV